MLNNYQNAPLKKSKPKPAAPPQGKPEAIPPADIQGMIDEYNQLETAAHAMKRKIFTALTARTGYKKILVGTEVFIGDPAALAATEYSDPPRLIKVESLGREE